MSDSTARGLTLRTQRSRRPRRNLFAFAIVVLFVALVPARRPLAVSQKESAQQDQKGPVFRVSTHLVTVDAYPTSDGGKIIKDLKPDDFEVYEDGKPQKVETLAFIDYDTPLPDDGRPVMLSARDGMELAADSRYRVIVIVLDRQAFDSTTWPPVRDA